MSTATPATPESETYPPLHDDRRPAPLSRRRRILGRVATVAAAVTVAAGAVGLGVWEANRDGEPGVPKIEPSAVAPPPPADPAPLTERISARFIAEPTVSQSRTGLTLTGEVPERAVATEQSARALAAHLTALTRDSCTDNVALVAPDNLQIRLWGFCFSALPDEDLADLLVYALETQASELVVTEHPSHGGERNANVKWFPATSATYDRALASWESLDKPDSLRQVGLLADGDGRMGEYLDSADLTDDGLKWLDNSTNQRREVSSAG